MPDVFNWAARVGDQGDLTFATSDAAFGDGYTQSVANGLNNKSGSWPYTYQGPQDEVQPIIDFLDAHGGYQSFLWTPPFGTQGLYRCKTYSLSPQGGTIVKLTATFTQTFA